MAFVHLHVHTQYSILDGLSNISKLFDRADALGMPALAITDHGNLYGVKEFFKFEWEWPKLKMPHFKMSGKFSLNPPSVPSFGVDWYAKAMNDPIVMNSPTAFGINANGQVMAGGEAGSEVVSGTNTLRNMIATAVSAQNKALEDKLAGIQSLMAEYMPQMANMRVVMDTGATVGALAPDMDSALGRLAIRNGRMA